MSRESPHPETHLRHYRRGFRTDDATLQRLPQPPSGSQSKRRKTAPPVQPGGHARLRSDARPCAETAVHGELAICIHDCGLQHRLNDGSVDCSEAECHVKTCAADLRVEHLPGRLKNGPFFRFEDGTESNVDCGEDDFVLEAEALVERQDVVDNAFTELLQEILGICIPVLLGCRDAELVLVHRCVDHETCGRAD
ncbi:uncharacterized protein B0I36DRAFT_436785 [Microdochium trichocladiopsis]|uniref:Uncharacterized protein n=1 Tax=Microdochium trichocladiopsis TaxID=1682393 RepID=A0A9P8XS86_9PEZI|nr:uncharacterized protein B0I36DRAFT_436785 [Microdochium trichocladiopsis]KAH7012202.1 hypothetical protein B0I36DRAFT_436785 [Microdochium trichocladiopsis]